MGPSCKFEHVKSIVADVDLTLSTLANFSREEDWIDKNAVAAITGHNLLPFHKPMINVLCHRCGKTGHKSTYCQDEQISQEELNTILGEDELYNA